MKLVILTALWKRPNLTRLVLRRYRAVQIAYRGRLDIELVAVGSEGGESRQLAIAEGWQYVEFPNRPLGRKWNAGMQLVKKIDPDGVVIVGSDDWLSTPTFDFYIECIEKGVPMAGLTDIYFLYWKTMRTLYFGGYTHDRLGESIGLGRFLSRATLEAIGWRPWWEGLNRGLDSSMTKTLRKKCPPTRDGSVAVDMAGIGACAIDIKTPVGICKFHSYVGSKKKDGSKNVKFVPTEELLRKHFPAGEVDALLRYVGSIRSGSSA